MLRSVLAAVLMLAALAALAAPITGLAAAGDAADGCAGSGRCCCVPTGLAADPAPGKSSPTRLMAGCRCGQHPPGVSHHQPSEPQMSEADGAALPRPTAARSSATPHRAPPLDLRLSPDPPPPRSRI